MSVENVLSACAALFPIADAAAEGILPAAVITPSVDQTVLIRFLWVAIALLLAEFLWIRRLRRVNGELERISVTDRLTGLFNRVRLDEQFDVEIKRAARFGQPYCIVLFDIDHFKSVNDTHGHQAGDAVLKEFARILEKNTRKVDVVGRWGGEEFFIHCTQTDLDGAKILAEHLREIIERHPFPVVGNKTASFGVTAYRQ